ncbi:hypothetical protein [Tumebacillus algifaecis]|nr:hypothetical protein [Tumebacillus algifaecis]
MHENGFVNANEMTREAMFELDVEVTSVQATAERNTWITGASCLYPPK